MTVIIMSYPQFQAFPVYVRVLIVRGRTTHKIGLRVVYPRTIKTRTQTGKAWNRG